MGESKFGLKPAAGTFSEQIDGRTSLKCHQPSRRCRTCTSESGGVRSRASLPPSTSSIRCLWPATSVADAASVRVTPNDLPTSSTSLPSSIRGSMHFEQKGTKETKKKHVARVSWPVSPCRGPSANHAGQRTHCIFAIFDTFEPTAHKMGTLRR